MRVLRPRISATALQDAVATRDAPFKTGRVMRNESEGTFHGGMERRTYDESLNHRMGEEVDSRN